MPNKFNFFNKKPRYIELPLNPQMQQQQPKLQLPITDTPVGENGATPAIPDGLWIKCDFCGELLYKKDFAQDLKVCKNCGHHYRMNAAERLESVVDEGTFNEFNAGLISLNPLDFDGYDKKLLALREKTGMNEAVITGCGKINGYDAVIGVLDSNFIMGSMGSVVGEKVTRAFEYAAENKLPIIFFTASGGARMQEGMYSLMQMAKTSAAAGLCAQAGQLYITVLTDPTTGGVTASFAMLGDIILSEPQALIGFAGKRVGEQTIGQKLPEGFQTAEFLLEHGFIDRIVVRKEMKATLGQLLALHVKN